MPSLKSLVKKYLWKSRIRNYSSYDLWVIQTDIKKKGYDAIAHKLRPSMKTPYGLDVDGFRRVDGRPIEGHKDWWKILDTFQAYVYDKGRGVKALVLFYKMKSPLNEFGDKIFYDKSEWGEKITDVTNVKRNEKGRIVGYYIENHGWLSKKQAIKLAMKGEIDNVVIVNGKSRVYLRSRPDSTSKNNFSKMGRS